MSNVNPEQNLESVDLSKTSSVETITSDPPSQPSRSTNCSPKSSSDTRKSLSESPNKSSKRKRKPKKVSGQQIEASDNEGGDLMQVDHELLEKPSNESIVMINSEQQKSESDCETIEKIAKMVSNITDVSDESLKPAETSSQEVLKQVETQLEEMFADVPQNTLNEQPKVEEPKPEEEVTEKKTLKVIKPRKYKKRKLDENQKKQPQPKKNGIKGKEGKKNGQPGKSKMNDDKASKSDKQDGNKLKKPKENGKQRVKNDVAPYLQISKDGSFAIINQTVNGDEDTDKAMSKQKKPVTTEKHKHIRGLHVSTLSNKYDADKRDTTWICVFCKLGPHKFKLGDLFGPYIISKKSSEYSLCLEDPANDIFRQSNKDKLAPVKSPVNTPKRKRKNSEITPNKKQVAPAVNGPDVSDEVFTGMTVVDENSYEIWFHEDCIVWSQGTYIIGTKIIGMEAAVWQSTRHRCGYCQKNGAMMACLSRGCTKEAHVICAKSWKLCEDFKTYCDEHIQ